ncbi:DEAD/DEAH box helicase [Lactobacillus sp. PV034]|uniref:DEAD/DEAH box helicase n=1 Tax=Lactobacillus sp. PV034 TaxID=2594495 RepID=UPI00223FBFE0|nr:DEAD/DEAH box helicase [Lactobacillus sp. PV034]QNQ80820.1 DEAD/DEAH box helicase [Lactobacillus sp. PV034]
MYPDSIKQILKKYHKDKPTLIQERTYEPIKNGASLVGLAKTGTGKTLAYGLPTLIRTKETAGLAIILEPTTELAIQTRNALLPYANSLDLKMLALVGAGNRKRQLEKLKKEKPSVLVCTPGRLFDFVSENKINIDSITSLVIDEADDILEFSKADLISSLGQNLASKSQILLFGASESTITKNAENLFNRTFLVIDVRPEQASVVKHYFLKVSNEYKLQYLQRLTKLDHFKGLVFFDSNENEHHFAKIFSHSKTSFEVLNNETNKQKRERILKDFKLGKIKLLLATDLAARGLDIANVTYVINFEVPDSLNTYIHRSGRTGRMNKAGTVVTLGDDHDLRNLRKLLDSEYKLERVYFDGYKLTITPPKTQKKKSNIKNSMAVNKKNKHKKRRWKKQKNKGYHPKKGELKSNGKNS